MAEIANLNGVSIDPDTITGFNKNYLIPVTGSDGTILPNFMAQVWAIYKASLATVGSTWRTGAGIPSNALGIDNDFYLRSNGEVYQRILGVYVLQTNLLGPQGVAGSGSTIHASQAGTGITVAPRSRINFVSGATVADNAGSDRIDITVQSASISRSARTSNTILDTADRGNLIDITSGTFTQTITSAATLTSGWFCYIRNGGTGDITIDPNGAETIDGLSSFVMYPSEVRLIQCDGVGFNSIVLCPFFRTFTSSGTFTKPPGYSKFGVRAWSGGSSGAKSAGAGGARGGFGGGCGDFILLASSVGATETVTIGAGGAAVTGAAGGNPGGNTTLGSLLTVYGGVNAAIGGSIIGIDTAAAGGVGAIGYEAAASGASVSAMSSVWGGAASNSTPSVASGNSIYGGAAGGSVTGAGSALAAGTSLFGGSGGAANDGLSATAGVAPGGGGGATRTGATSGAGARGEVRIWGMV